MNNHTPGPWRFDQTVLGCKTIKGGKSGRHRQAQYREIASTHGIVPEHEDFANARLIAAAPDLLEALKAILGHVESDDIERVHNQCTLCHHYRTLGHAAVAKATTALLALHAEDGQQ